jgi:hypothetical protein
LNNNIASLDFYNLHFFLRVDNKEYYWQELNKFIEDTGYPFADTTGYVSYEPYREIYHVERKDTKEVSLGIEQPEIQWFIDNKYSLLGIIEQLIESDKFTITGLMQRAQYLADTDWLVQRHQEQMLRSVTTTLSQQQIIDLLNYKQELRDLTQHYNLTQPAENISWPYNPIR